MTGDQPVDEPPDEEATDGDGEAEPSDGPEGSPDDAGRAGDDGEPGAADDPDAESSDGQNDAGGDDTGEGGTETAAGSGDGEAADDAEAAADAEGDEDAPEIGDDEPSSEGPQQDDAEAAAEPAEDDDGQPDDGEAGETEGPDAIDDDYEVEVPPYAQVDGPSEDQEMPLADHIEEMLKRLAVIIAIAGVVSLVTFPIAEELINFLWNSILPEGQLTRPRLYGILELKLTELKVASLAGLIVALPVLVQQTYEFMRPGLYPHERRYYLAAIPTSLVLALIGVSFAYFIVLPAIFTYFLYYSQDVATIGFALGRTFDLILILMGYLAIVFQIPLFIMLAMMMGLVTRQWLADRRILFWGGFLGLSFIFSPDPTGMAPIVVALTMVVLFEGTLLLTKWTQRRS